MFMLDPSEMVDVQWSRNNKTAIEFFLRGRLVGIELSGTR